MEHTEGGDQESLPKRNTRRNNQQLQDQLENICLAMKQGIGKAGRSGGGDGENDTVTDTGVRQQNDSSTGGDRVCSEELCDLDVTITNENISDFNPSNVSSVDGVAMNALNGLDVTEEGFKSGAKGSETEIENVSTTSYSLKLQSVDVADIVSLEEMVISDKEIDIYLFDNDGSETLHIHGNEADENIEDALNRTIIENADFRAFERSRKITGDGSDSGVEVTGCTSFGGRESSPALLRAFSGNSGGYASSCGGHEDSLTATPAASCDSSLISCYSACEETDDIVTSTTTMMMPLDGDGTSEGGSESSSVSSKDVRNGNPKNSSSKRVTPGANRVSANKRTPIADVAKNSGKSVINKAKSVCRAATPVNSSRPKSASSHHQTPVTSKTPSPNVGASAVISAVMNTSSHKREKVAAKMTVSCGAIKSNSNRFSASGSNAKSSLMSKSVCGTIVGVTKVNSKDSSLSSGSEGWRDTASVSTPSTVKGKGTRNTSNIRNKVIGGTDDGRWPSSASKSHSVTPRSRGGSALDGQPRKLNVSGSPSVVSNLFMESKATALEKYATLPRRRRCKSPEVPATFETTVRSHSISRDPSLNRAASLRKQHHQKEGTNFNKSLPPYPRRSYHGRTVIYHETSSQTALTASDVEKALTGVSVNEPEPLDAIETQDQEVQASVLFLTNVTAECSS